MLGAGLDATVQAAQQRGYDAGPVRPFTRQTADGQSLRWRLAYRHYTMATMPANGVVPFLIEWEPECRAFAPAATAPQGCELLSLHAVASKELASRYEGRQTDVEGTILLLTA